jgi:hypothetical protein
VVSSPKIEKQQKEIPMKVIDKKMPVMVTGGTE